MRSYAEVRTDYRQRRRQRGCQFCVEPTRYVIDYKNVALLERFLDDQERIRKSSKTGVCRRHQSRLAQQIKRAREMALLPYTVG